MSKKNLSPGFLLQALMFVHSLFIYSFSSAQSDVTEVIQKHFNQYQQDNLHEKLFVHTDRNSYISGEILWFKTYCVNAANNQLLDLSKVAYAEVLDRNNQPVLQAKIALQNGTGSGSLLLPPTLHSGNYTFRAYTNWMKNFGADSYFQKTVTIINTLQIETPDTAKITNQLDAQFFPEGGDMVNGFKSRVAFRVTNGFGRGINFDGAIVSQNNDTVVKFRPDKFGIGSFIFTPARSNTYKAVIKPEDGNAVIKILPQVRDIGTVLTVADNITDNKLKITIQTGTSYAPTYLIIHSQQHITTAATINIKNGLGETEVDINKLAEGISYITLFNSESQPVAERLYFKKIQKKLLVDASAERLQYDTRKKVTIDVATKNEVEKTVSANMSMAVFLIDSSLHNIEDISSYLSLSSDLQGTVEHPEYYFSDTSIATREALDNLMLTHGWRRFKWEDVFAEKKPLLRFLPEYEGHIVTGKVSNTLTGTPAANIVSYLSVPGVHFQLYTSKSNDEGTVYFNTKNLYGTKLVIAQADGEENSRFRIDFTNPFSESYSSIKSPAFSYAANTASNLITKSINMQVKSIYAEDTVYSLPAPVDTTLFFGKPDSRYFLDDYTRFPTMEEVLREYVREINVRKRSGSFELSMIIKDENGNFDKKKPVVLLDGVPQFDNGNRITNYSALKVKQLEIVLGKHYLGPATLDGIASFTTYKGDLEGFQIDTASTVVDYDALQMKREFSSPAYRTEEESESRLPDFRNLLYWKPDLTTGENGKQQVNFYTSDQPGNYAVVLQGISAAGNTGSKVFMIKVNIAKASERKQQQ